MSKLSEAIKHIEETTIAFDTACEKCAYALRALRALDGAGSMTFGSFAEINRARNRLFESLSPNFVDWSETDWACALAGEVGELCNLIKKRRRGEDIPTEEVAREMGDVFAYLDLLAEEVGVNLGEWIVRKFNEVSDRRPESAHFKIARPSLDEEVKDGD